MCKSASTRQYARSPISSSRCIRPRCSICPSKESLAVAGAYRRGQGLFVHHRARLGTLSPPPPSSVLDSLWGSQGVSLDRCLESLPSLLRLALVDIASRAPRFTTHRLFRRQKTPSAANAPLAISSGGSSTSSRTSTARSLRAFCSFLARGASRAADLLHPPSRLLRRCCNIFRLPLAVCSAFLARRSCSRDFVPSPPLLAVSPTFPSELLRATHGSLSSSFQSRYLCPIAWIWTRPRPDPASITYCSFKVLSAFESACR
jgi:hypothetical protein